MRVVFSHGVSSLNAEEPGLSPRNPYTVYRKKFPREQRVQLHRHSSLEINVCHNARGILQVEGREHDLSGIQIAVILPGILHSYKIRKGSGPIDVIHISPAGLKDFINAEGLTKRLVSLGRKISAADPLFRELLPQVRRLMSEDKVSKYRLSTVVFEILDFISTKQGVSDLYRENPRLLQIINYAQENFSRDIGTADAATASGMSVPAFCRFFKEHTGSTYGKYLTDVRLEYAQTKLYSAASSISITEIALEAGFYDASHFIARFKEKFGTTPARYRRFMRVSHPA